MFSMFYLLSQNTQENAYADSITSKVNPSICSESQHRPSPVKVGYLHQSLTYNEFNSEVPSGCSRSQNVYRSLLQIEPSVASPDTVPRVRVPSPMGLLEGNTPAARLMLSMS